MAKQISQRIMNAITKEDTFKLFCPPSQPNICDFLARIPEECTLQEYRAHLCRFFAQIVQHSEPKTFYHSEAQRMLAVIDVIFTELHKELSDAPSVPRPAARDALDDVVDIYMESLKNFAAGLDEKVLQDHIWYLEH